MNKSKPMTDTTKKAKKMTVTGRKPSNPNLQPLPIKACEPSDNIEQEMKNQRIDAFESPESSNIASASYDYDTAELHIAFKSHKGDSPRMYSYGKFPSDLWHMFKNSPSKGGFFATQIKGGYTGIAL